MLVFFIGGAASGKSELCENTVCKMSGKKLYIATMKPHGEEAEKRIQRHITLRMDKGFESVDCYTKVAKIKNSCGFENVILECMSNLVANEMFDEDGDVSRIVSDIELLQKEFKNIFIVSNDVFSDGGKYSEETDDYIKNIGNINIEISKKADAVIETVAGIPIIHKGRELIEKYI